MRMEIPNYMRTKKTDPKFEKGINELCEIIGIPADPSKRNDNDNWMLVLALIMLFSGGNLKEILDALRSKNDPSKLPELRCSD